MVLILVSFDQDFEDVIWGELTFAYHKKIPPKTRDIGLILLSGGLDSLVAATIAKKNHNWLLAAFFNYGQRGREIERRIAQNIARKLNIHSFVSVKHSLLKATTELAGVSLLDASQPLPQVSYDDLENIEKLNETVESVYVPFRQASFYISLAALGEAICRSTEVEKAIIYAGGHATDAITFPDESVEFTHSIKQLLRNGTKYGQIDLNLPLLHQTKQQVVESIPELRIESLIPFSCSCYRPIGVVDEKPVHCGVCEACTKRRAAFKAVKMHDTTIYQD